MQEAVCYAAGRQEVADGVNVKPVGGDVESSKLRPEQQLPFVFFLPIILRMCIETLRCN